MRILGDNANETPGVEMVGVHVYDDHMNTVSPIKNRFTLENFGQCAAIGSGMNFAKKLAAEWDRMTNRPNNPHDCYEIIRGFSSAFCSAILANEFIFSNIESWGGFIEYASYFDDNKSWSYGPKSAYTFAFIEFIGDNKFTIHQINKFVLYEGNINCGRILSIHQDDRKFIATQWVLENIIGYNIPADDPKFWNGWFPDSITTCFIFPKEMNYAISHKTTDWHQKNEFTCEIRDNYVKLGLSDNLIDEVGLELTGFLKRSYIEQKYKIFYSS